MTRPRDERLHGPGRRSGSGAVSDRAGRPITGPGLVLIALAAALALCPALADAHASLVKSSPARRATLSQSPPRVELTFNERLEPAYAAVSVWDAAGQQVDRRDAAVAGDDPRQLRVSLPPLAPGTYTVRFRVLSVDGHIVESSFSFTVRAPAGR
jgi:methionine-rich copper-binding protein CopC